MTVKMLERKSPYVERARIQAEILGLPAFPTTTIGSFPQTAEVRHARAEHNRGNLDEAPTSASCANETERAIRCQEEVGLDVLVHGEFERNDMVQYFGEQLAGFAFTAERLGPVLRIALRASADHLRRRVAARTDDGRLVRATRSRSPTGRSRACSPAR